MEYFGIIANEYSGVISRTVGTQVQFNVEGCWTEKEFENKISPLFKQQYINIVILDVTCLKDHLLEGIRYLKLNIPSTVRLIVLAPNLKDEAIYQQILVYGVFDVLRPEVDKEKMSDVDIENQVMSELQWAIQEPTTFAKVADKLAISVISQTVIEQITEPEKAEKTKKEKPGKKIIQPLNKPRLVGFYKDTDESFDWIKKASKYNLVALYPETVDLTQTDISYADILVFDNVSLDLLTYVKSLVDVNEDKAVVIAGYSNEEDELQAKKISGVNTFTYNDSHEFAREVSINSVQKTEIVRDNNCQIYSIYGVKGGTGATTITAIMAKEYAKKHPGSRVIAIDFSAKSGDLGGKFAILKADPNIYECVASFIKANNEHLDITLLRDKILEYCHYDKKSKVYVLPTSYTDIYRYTNYRESTEDIAYIYEFILRSLKQYFDAIFVDATKYGGFPYETAVDNADKIILVGDGKLASIWQLQNKIDDLTDVKLNNKVTVIVNKSNPKVNENEYDNLNVLKSKIDKNRILVLPYDKELAREEDELDTVCGSKFRQALDGIWKISEPLKPSEKKKGIFGK